MKCKVCSLPQGIIQVQGHGPSPFYPDHEDLFVGMPSMTVEACIPNGSSDVDEVKQGFSISDGFLAISRYPAVLRTQ